MRSKYWVGEGDHDVVIRTQLTDEDGNAVNVAQAINIAFRMRKARTREAPVVDGVATAFDPNNGIVQYKFMTGETDIPGEYDAQWIVTFSLGEVQTFPGDGYDRVIVIDDLAD